MLPCPRFDTGGLFMRRAIAAALLAFALTTAPTSAQLFPTASPTTDQPVAVDQSATVATPNKTLIDTTLIVRPGDMEEMCFVSPPGTLTAHVALVGDHSLPVSLKIWSRQGTDDIGNFKQLAGRDPLDRSVVLTGGGYCFGLHHESQIPTWMPNSERGKYEQDVELRMTLAPPS